MRHLPYITTDGNDKAQGAGYCNFADWRAIARSSTETPDGRWTSPSANSYKESTEDFTEPVPPHVVGLTDGWRNFPVFLLDTKLGIVHWTECPGGISDLYPPPLI